MIGFVLTRIAGLAGALFLAAFVVFAMLDPAGETASFWPRFGGWIGGALTGDLGDSASGPVWPLVAARLAVTGPLALLALALAAVAGVPLGVLVGARPGPATNAVIAGASLLTGALPAFWLGMLLALVLSALLRWLPAGGFVPWQQNPLGALGSLLLPALALAASPAAQFAAAARDATEDMRASGFIRTARLKGMTLGQAILRHGLRNASLPLIGMLGPQFALLLAGAIVVENVFYLPGLGRLIFTASSGGDVAVLRGGVLALMAAVAAALLLADLLRLLADPRLRRGSLG